MINYIGGIDEWAICQCSCGKKFDVDACFQENLILINNRLHAQCPSCLYIEVAEEVGCLRVYDKIEII
ncbi:hypothetical protein DRO61_11945 [Candidatus Bathyarchaeota archaeon]|nr:MAG: hypothetical protein DRO61_11945 [Candidatus Bathyarchaeota archaeon]